MLVSWCLLLVFIGLGGASDYAVPSFRNVPAMVRDYQSGNLEKVKQRLSGPMFSGLSTLDIAKGVLEALPINISETCANQSLALLQNLKSSWALQMLDSIGKPVAGLLEGNIIWLGDFDECRSVSSGDQNGQQISGQYCKLTYPVVLGGRAAAVTIGACVPSGCSSSDTEALANTVLFLLGMHNGTTFTADCHLSDRPFDTGAYVAIVVVSLFAAFLAVGTLYDIFLNISTATCRNREYENSCGKSGSSSCNNSEATPLLNGSVRSELLDESKVPGEKGLLAKLLISFSLYTNAKKLLSTAQPDKTLSCLHGIRFVSMCWVILGHAYVFTTAVMSDPSMAYAQILKRRSFQVIFNASVSVDTFFFLSGLLVTYICLKEFEKRRGKLSWQEWVLMYVHRYIRLTAVYAILLMIWACLADHFYDGPLWPSSGSLDVPCTKYWWTNLIYINNFIPTIADKSASCMDWTWYLANDMQFFLITPVLVFLLYRVWYVGLAITGALTLASVAVSAAVSMEDSLGMSFAGAQNPADAAEWFYDLYEKPWCRFQTYGVGILLAYLLNQRKGKTALPLHFVIGGWIAAALLGLTIIYAPYDAEFGSRAATVTLSESAAYNSLSRLSWAAALSWIVFACSTNQGGWINTLLSWKPFIPLARLTYCAYLIHPILYTVSELGSRDMLHFDDVTVTLKYIGILVMSMAFGFLASISFEAPMMGVEKLLLHPSKK